MLQGISRIIFVQAHHSYSMPEGQDQKLLLLFCTNVRGPLHIYKVLFSGALHKYRLKLKKFSHKSKT